MWLLSNQYFHTQNTTNTLSLSVYLLTCRIVQFLNPLAAFLFN